jgi:hypothetical protein
MTDESVQIKRILGLNAPFRIGTRAVELYPVRLKDWVDFRKCAALLEEETLYGLFSYLDGEEALENVFKIICRTEEVPEIFSDMTQADYERFRNIVIEQNDLNFKEVKKKLREAQTFLASPRE